MTYTFVDISTTKFSINGREYYKTFMAYYISDSKIMVFNVNNSQIPLMPATLVSDIDINGTTYANSTLLINALTDVLYAREGSPGALDQAQIEQNRVDILALDSGKADTAHNHDSRYYTESEIDTMFGSLPGAIPPNTQGEVDGNNLNIRKADNSITYTIDVSELRGQGVMLEVSGQTVTLKDESGNQLSQVTIIPDVVDADSTHSKLGKWVIGSIPGVFGGSDMIGKSNAIDPTNESHFDKFLIVK